MNWAATGAIALGLAVMLGAFGAHALASIGAQRLGWWTTATHYHFIAALALMLTGAYDRARIEWLSPASLLLLGSLIFSGSLYALALGAPRWFGAVTPLGGLSLVAAFVWLGFSALR